MGDIDWSDLIDDLLGITPPAETPPPTIVIPLATDPELVSLRAWLDTLPVPTQKALIWRCSLLWTLAVEAEDYVLLGQEEVEQYEPEADPV
jgi:hypothetical protein